MALALHKSINNEGDEEGDLCPMVPTPNDVGSYPAVSGHKMSDKGKSENSSHTF